MRLYAQNYGIQRARARSACPYARSYPIKPYKILEDQMQYLCVPDPTGGKTILKNNVQSSHF
jgi:hypothetical protein